MELSPGIGHSWLVFDGTNHHREQLYDLVVLG